MEYTVYGYMPDLIRFWQRPNDPNKNRYVLFISNTGIDNYDYGHHSVIRNQCCGQNGNFQEIPLFWIAG